MLFTAPPSLLSSADLISVVDDPFSSRLEGYGEGWAVSGRVSDSSVYDRVTVVEKPVWLHGCSKLGSRLIQGEKKNAPGARFFWE